MADEKLNTGPEAAKTEEAPAPVAAAPARSEAPAPEHQPEQTGPRWKKRKRPRNRRPG